MRLFGIDFTSAPRARKPITIASAHFDGARLRVTRVDEAPTFDAFDAFLAKQGPWTGGFDFPFGLPRTLLDELDWPREARDGDTAWARMVRHVGAMPRAHMVAAFAAYCDARPAGSKFAHRPTDLVAGSSPSMKWVNPPVSFMLQAGAPRLLAAGVCVPGLQPGDAQRVALEAYPGVLARSVVGRRSYKSDSKATGDREAGRREIVDAIMAGAMLGLDVTMPARLRAACIADGSGDCLDAVLCVLQAAWAHQRRDQRYGLPAQIDPVEGWIVGV